MYLYWWERIVRKASGDSTFAIGYWRYDPADPPSLSLPAPFRTPTVGNPLFSPRNPAINAGAPMPPSTADSSSALIEPLLLPPPFPGFSSSVEGTPHGAVHVTVGGLMGSVPTAANDPIFWTHHANIDRLWSRWLDDASHANPASGPFLTTAFEFFDENGKRHKMRGKDVLKTVEQLCYRYDDDPLVPGGAAGGYAARGGGEGAMTESKILAAQPEPRHTLGPEPSTMKLDLSPAAKEEIGAAVAAGGRRRIVLAFEDASVKGTPDTNYEVYLNLPAGQRAPGVKSPHFAGTLSFFGLEEAAAHAKHGGPRTLTLNVTRTLASLQEAQALKGDSLSVTLVPVQPGVEPGAPVKTQAVPSFRRMVLRSE
jgi:tyrosinase